MNADDADSHDDPLREAMRAAARMDREARTIRKLALGPETGHGTFFPPAAYEVDGILALEGEVFGPILHIARFDDEYLDAVIDDINLAGFGLTVSVHSRIDAAVDRPPAAATPPCSISRNSDPCRCAILHAPPAPRGAARSGFAATGRFRRCR